MDPFPLIKCKTSPRPNKRRAPAEIPVTTSYWSGLGWCLDKDHKDPAFLPFKDTLLLRRFAFPWLGFTNRLGRFGFELSISHQLWTLWADERWQGPLWRPMAEDYHATCLDVGKIVKASATALAASWIAWIAEFANCKWANWGADTSKAKDPAEIRTRHFVTGNMTSQAKMHNVTVLILWSTSIPETVMYEWTPEHELRVSKSPQWWPARIHVPMPTASGNWMLRKAKAKALRKASRRGLRRASSLDMALWCLVMVASHFSSGCRTQNRELEELLIHQLAQSYRVCKLQ